MTDPLSKTPFAKLLIPAIGGIVATSYCTNYNITLVTATLGISVMLILYISKWRYLHSIRWLWAVGMYALIFAIFSLSTTLSNKQAQHSFQDCATHYIGTIASIPEEKAKSFACNIHLHHPNNKKIVAYLQKEDNARSLKPGEEIIFFSQIDSIRNFGNPDDFDYERYMHNKGFAGSTYIPTSSWQTTGNNNQSINTIALQVRQRALNIYSNISLDTDAQSFISALTLGHKDDLSNEIKEAFRASGTSHILAVSGLHVGIVFGAITLIFSLFATHGRLSVIKQIVIIATLWLYAFVTGLSPSVIRATVMLTIALIGKASGKRLFTYNVLAASAFLILSIKPNQLYDAGFQMSFAAVASIIAINPILVGAFNPQRKLTNSITNLFTVSLSAQIGVLPITLYYFGTFPTYFFIANMLIIPAIPIVIYISIAAVTTSALISAGATIIEPVHNITSIVLQSVINMILKVVYFIEALPMAQINNLYITLPQTLIAIICMALALIFINTRKPQHITLTLCAVLLLTISFITPKLQSRDNHLVIYNTPNSTDISLLIDGKKEPLSNPQNGYIIHNKEKIILLSDNRLKNLTTSSKLEIDILVLTKDKSFNITQLCKLFTFNKLILDSTIPLHIRNRWIKECDVLGIDTHDVSQKGAFFIKL